MFTNLVQISSPKCRPFPSSPLTLPVMNSAVGAAAMMSDREDDDAEGWVEGQGGGERGCVGGGSERHWTSSQ